MTSFAAANPEQMLTLALAAARQGEFELRDVLAALPAPIYTTDAQGVVTFFNSACVGFAGRTPAVGKDRWCVTWKLYTEDGEFLPHDECPMALTIHSRRPVRGLTAVAQRPDGTRVTFTPFPTPLFDRNGGFVGAVNMLIDVAELRQIAELEAQAERCRRLMRGVSDRQTIDALSALANECEAKAAGLRTALDAANQGSKH